MTQHARFLFETEFTAEKKREAEPKVTLHEHHELIAHAREEGFHEGLAHGRAEAEVSIARDRESALMRLGQHLSSAADALGALEPRLEAEAIDIGVAVATKLAQDLVDRYPMAEIRALVADCFANLRTVPHLVVRVHDDLLDDARSELTRLASERGFEGRLVIMAEPSIARGDCRIEWASGGIVVDRAETQNRIAEAVNRFLTTPTLTPGVNHE